MPWPKEHDDALIALVADGLTFAACAAALNRQFQTDHSRNAAIGRAKRLGLASQSGKKGNDRAGDNFQTAPAREKHRLHYAKRKRSRSVDDKIKTAARSNLPTRFLRPAIAPKIVCDAPMMPEDGGASQVTLIEVEGCRWPSGDGIAVAFSFCNSAKDKGVPYCAGHLRLARRAA